MYFIHSCYPHCTYTGMHSVTLLYPIGIILIVTALLYLIHYIWTLCTLDWEESLRDNLTHWILKLDWVNSFPRRTLGAKHPERTKESCWLSPFTSELSSIQVSFKIFWNLINSDKQMTFIFSRKCVIRGEWVKCICYTIHIILSKYTFISLIHVVPGSCASTCI